MSLAGLRIVLVEVAGVSNVGAIARVMIYLGYIRDISEIYHLIIVNCQCNPHAKNHSRSIRGIISTTSTSR